MKGTMKVAVMNGIGKMGYTTRPIPTPKEDEVLVKLEYVGICGSDMHYYETGAIGNYVVKPPFVLGHEPGGTVVEVGSAVKHLKVGDRVALEPGKTCGHCKFCREGKYNLCPDVVFFATPPVDGVFQEYVAHEANLCFKLPDNVSTMEGALIEPLAVGFHAANQGGAHAGQTAVVMGAGCIGLVSMMALKAEGVSRVYVVDIMQKRLDKALELGADGVINSREKDAVQTILDLTDGLGCDLVIETAGTEITTRQAIEMAQKGANIVLVGYSKSGEMTLPMSLALDKELTFKTVFRYRHIYPMAIDAVASGKINLKGIVTNIFDFDDIQNAMDKSISDKANIVKAVVKIAEETKACQLIQHELLAALHSKEQAWVPSTRASVYFKLCMYRAMSFPFLYSTYCISMRAALSASSLSAGMLRRLPHSGRERGNMYEFTSAGMSRCWARRMISS